MNGIYWFMVLETGKSKVEGTSHGRRARREPETDKGDSKVILL
jgi:hypothetical protein